MADVDLVWTEDATGFRTELCRDPGKEPALAKATIYEVAIRPWGWLVTSAEVDDCMYVGSREWRRQQLDNNKSSRNQA
jgi:hypothetical protein